MALGLQNEDTLERVEGLGHVNGKYDSVGLRIDEDISSSAMYINW
jgi:hypothetical protein